MTSHPMAGRDFALSELRDWEEAPDVGAFNLRGIMALDPEF